MFFIVIKKNCHSGNKGIEMACKDRENREMMNQAIQGCMVRTWGWNGL